MIGLKSGLNVANVAKSGRICVAGAIIQKWYQDRIFFAPFAAHKVFGRGLAENPNRATFYFWWGKLTKGTLLL